jgi:hypothetical protein
VGRVGRPGRDDMGADEAGIVPLHAVS